MERLVSTPTSPNADPICEGFIICVESVDMKPMQAAIKAVNEYFPGNWDVSSISGVSQDFEVRKLSKNQKIPISLAWELSRKIEKSSYISRAEPELILPGINPSLSQVYTNDEIKQKYSNGKKSFLSRKDLPCAMDNCEWNLEEDQCAVKPAWELDLPNPKIGKHYGEGIRIGHPDTGFTDHPEINDPPEIKDKRLLIEEGEDFEDYDSNSPITPRDKLVGLSPGHGTGTASVIMSAIGPKNNIEHVTGVAPKAKLVPIRVATSVAHLSFGNLTKAIYHATIKNCHIISMSLGGPIGWWYLHNAIKAAVKEDVILFAAAGNFWPRVIYPAKFPEVIAVAACNCDKDLWRFSAKGGAVDITAPGESVWRAETKKDKNGIKEFNVNPSSGTSYAVAMVAGACALWLAHHGRERLIKKYEKHNLAKVFKYILTKYGVDKPPGWNTDYWGAGILNVKKLLNEKLHEKSEVLNDILSPKKHFIAPDVDDFMDFFPEMYADDVKTGLSRILPEDLIKKTNGVSGLKKELLFHIATNPSFRVAIAEDFYSKGTKRSAIKTSLKDNKKFIKNASESLKDLFKI